MDFFVLIGGGMLLMALPGLAYPALVGWRTRRDAAVVLLAALCLLSVVLLV